MVNIRAYLRLARFDKPVGIWLLLLPCWFGLALAGNKDLWLYVAYGIGAIVMRAAGCVINDMADRNFDAKVERTKTRPLASGEISMKQALVFLAILLSIGLGVLLTLPVKVIYLGFSIMPLVVLYPFMKRITYWPQLMLGIVFNYGILMGYLNAAGTLDAHVFIMYLGAIFWTLGYDTIYAHQDKDDDIKIGVKSTALKLGEKTKYFVTACYAKFLFCFFVTAVYELGFKIPFVPIFLIAAAHMVWQVRVLDINNRENCLMLFKSNVHTGLLLFVALVSAIY